VNNKKINFRELDINNIGGWPRQAQLLFCGIVAFVILVIGWSLVVRGQQKELGGLQAQEADLKSEFATKQGRAANLEPLKQQLDQMKQQLQQMLRQLPSKTEMPDLIVDVSQTALATGIQNDLFQPGQETKKDFYAEKPITLRMVGTYHQFGAFVSGVASLPRVVIMTMHDISLKPKNETPGARIGGNTPLELSGTVKTYRYLDEEEAAQSAAPATAGGAAAAPAPAQGGN